MWFQVQVHLWILCPCFTELLAGRSCTLSPMIFCSCYPSVSQVSPPENKYQCQSASSLWRQCLWMMKEEDAEFIRGSPQTTILMTPCEREQDWTCKVLDLTKSWSTRWGAPEQKSPIRGVPYWVTVVRPQYSCCTVIDWATWSKHGLASEVKADPEDATSGHSDNSLIVAEQVLPWREDHSVHSQLLLDSA